MGYAVHCPVERAANFRVGWDESPAKHDRGTREGLRSPLNRREGLRRAHGVASLTGGEAPEAGTFGNYVRGCCLCESSAHRQESPFSV